MGASSSNLRPEASLVKKLLASGFADVKEEAMQTKKVISFQFSVEDKPG
jgi:hypothetical protein